jgi:sirohydrochlorin ferrochelatase
VPEPPALLVMGHGSRSPAGVAQYWDLVTLVGTSARGVPLGGGFIELSEPDLDRAVDELVSAGARTVVAVPLVLLGASHLKVDGPSALARARRRHPGVRFTYGRDLGIHPLVLAAAGERAGSVVGDSDPGEWTVALIGRGSSDPDANADLFKVARLIQYERGFAMVEPGFVSLAPPSVPQTLERCRQLGATRIVVLPYFLFTGVLVDRIRAQAAAWAARHPALTVRCGPEIGPHPLVAALVLQRYREALDGDARMNCDCCVYRAALLEGR